MVLSTQVGDRRRIATEVFFKSPFCDMAKNAQGKVIPFPALNLKVEHTLVSNVGGPVSHTSMEDRSFWGSDKPKRVHAASVADILGFNPRKEKPPLPPESQPIEATLSLSEREALARRIAAERSRMVCACGCQLDCTEDKVLDPDLLKSGQSG